MVLYKGARAQTAHGCNSAGVVGVVCVGKGGVARVWRRRARVYAVKVRASGSESARGKACGVNGRRCHNEVGAGAKNRRRGKVWCRVTHRLLPAIIRSDYTLTVELKRDA